MKKPGSILTILVIAPSVSMLLAALVIGDCRLFIFMNQAISNPLLDILCAYGSPVVFVAFYLFSVAKLCFFGGDMTIAGGGISGVTGLAAYGVGSLVKTLVGRPRPYVVVPSARVIGPWSASSFSFPSTTTMLVFGLTIPLLLISQKRSYGIVLLVLSYFVGFSVIYTGFHFPVDVAAGALLSLGLGISMNEIVRRTKVRVVKDVQRM
jgi:undecaprenyl-diphosphatase